MERLLAFIREHATDDPAALLLARERYPDIDLSLAVSTLQGKRQIRRKLPTWYATEDLLYPSKLSTEQCSSEETARFKASLAAALVPADSPLRVADLTGGLGVDSWAFSLVAQEVLYNEKQSELCAAVRHNMARLGRDNLIFSHRTLSAEDLETLLTDFRPNLVYLDPARRDEAGGKVFRLEDCTPRVDRWLPMLLRCCPQLMIKLSPMADIGLICRQLSCVTDVHILAAGGECKELLLLLRQGASGAYRIHVGSWSFLPEEEAHAIPHYVQPENLSAYPLLFEPGKALAKAGAFRLLSERFGLGKLDPSTHLYLGDRLPESLLPLGKRFRIDRVFPFGKAAFREIRALLPEGRAEVSAHNIPIRSEELSRKIGLSTGNPAVHLFGVQVSGGRYLLLCTRL